MKADPEGAAAIFVAWGLFCLSSYLFLTISDCPFAQTTTELDNKLYWPTHTLRVF